MTCPDLLIKENVMEYRTEVSKMEDKERRMWKVTNKDGSVLEIDRDNSLIIYLNTLNNESDLEEIVRIEKNESDN